MTGAEMSGGGGVKEWPSQWCERVVEDEMENEGSVPSSGECSSALVLVCWHCVVWPGQHGRSTMLDVETLWEASSRRPLCDQRRLPQPTIDAFAPFRHWAEAGAVSLVPDTRNDWPDVSSRSFAAVCREE